MAELPKPFLKFRRMHSRVARQIRHVVALAPPTLDFPTTVAAFTWIEESLSSRAVRSARRARR